MRRQHFISFIGILMISFALALSATAQDKRGTEEMYTIKQGDTLWDISSRFLKNPFLWPKLWQRNPYITNPHWIYPGQPVRLTALEEPKKEEPQKVAEAEKPKAMPKEEEVKKAESPRVEKKAEAAEAKPAEGKPGETKAAAQLPLGWPEIRSAGFFSDVEVHGVGMIIESKEGKTLISEGDIVYIAFRTREPANIGDKFTLFRASHLFGNYALDNVRAGKRYSITGNIQVIDRDGAFYVAKVIEAFQEIYKGDRIRPYWKEKMEIGEGAK